MFSNLSTDPQESATPYPIYDNSLSFKDYISACRAIIQEKRLDLGENRTHAQKILDANSPFEAAPKSHASKYKYGALLIHGLLDCPFSLRDLADKLQAHGILSRAILLPGHGTSPSDLLNITYQAWIDAVQYGVESIRDQVDKLYLIGYSTGAALSIYQALRNENISGIVLLSPAVKIKAPVDIVMGWHYCVKSVLLRNQLNWAYCEPEIDYAKYHSIPFNAVNQVSMLTKEVKRLRAMHALHSPMLMIVSRDDETISCTEAVNFFSSMTHAQSKLLLYTGCKKNYKDTRIQVRNACYPTKNIDSFSHISIPFAPNNSHYGVQGDYIEASHESEQEFIYGAYNRIQVRTYRWLYQAGIVSHPRRELTYNPDFDFMADTVINFVTQ